MNIRHRLDSGLNPQGVLGPLVSNKLPTTAIYWLEEPKRSNLAYFGSKGLEVVRIKSETTWSRPIKEHKWTLKISSTETLTTITMGLSITPCKGHHHGRPSKVWAACLRPMTFVKLLEMHLQPYAYAYIVNFNPFTCQIFHAHWFIHVCSSTYREIYRSNPVAPNHFQMLPSSRQVCDEARAFPWAQFARLLKIKQLSKWWHMWKSSPFMPHVKTVCQLVSSIDDFCVLCRRFWARNVVFMVDDTPSEVKQWTGTKFIWIMSANYPSSYFSTEKILKNIEDISQQMLELSTTLLGSWQQ